MPPNQTRDGSWNTNNWAETAFKTFDTVFLDNRMNKRWAALIRLFAVTEASYSIDRLASIIINDFLPFFRHWRPRNRPLNKLIIALHTKAHNLWEQDMVIQIDQNTFDVRVVKYGVSSVN
jgi:hypothetical protein